MSKLKTLLKDGLKPYNQGKKNYLTPIQEVEDLARERLKACLQCEHFKPEPIDFLKVEDQRITEFSEMMCGDCGCELPYKSRQSISICKKWQQ